MGLHPSDRNPLILELESGFVQSPKFQKGSANSFQILNLGACPIECKSTYYKCSPPYNNCHANDEDIKTENTEHDDDEQEGEVDSGK